MSAGSNNVVDASEELRWLCARSTSLQVDEQALSRVLVRRRHQ